MDLQCAKNEEALKIAQYQRDEARCEALQFSHNLKEMTTELTLMRQRHSKHEEIMQTSNNKLQQMLHKQEVWEKKAMHLESDNDQLKSKLNEMESEHRRISIQCDSFKEVNDHLKQDIDKLRHNTVNIERYQELKQKCVDLSNELSQCYHKIERLSVALEQRKMELNHLSCNCVPLVVHSEMNKQLSFLRLLCTVPCDVLSLNVCTLYIKSCTLASRIASAAEQ